MAFGTKRVLVGRPLRSSSLHEQLLPKRLALPVFCSDPISSVAYATQEMLLILTLGGLSLLHLALWDGLAIVILLAIVVASYRQTCYAYPNGGGAYVVSKENLGENASLVAASALLVDYVLTVAVSVVAGVAAIVSYAPGMAPHAVELSLGFVALLTVVNLRGVKESGRGFALPTYGFILGIYAMFAWAAWKLAAGEELRAVSADFDVRGVHQATGILVLVLALRAFASGCTALTGVEAISNGVPAFRKPKSRNAATTLAIMGGLAITMFSGITILALVTDVHMVEDPSNLIGTPPGYVEPTALAQVAEAVFGDGLMFAFIQAATAGILILAANTAYNGFPVLASILSRDSFLPRQLHNRGDRLVFSNGIALLAGCAALLIVAFDADVSRLIQLYIIGVFVSFTLSQLGMVRHWSRELATVTDRRRRVAIRRSQVINAVGASATALVLVIVLVTKFTHGAWIVCLAMPALFLLMRRIRRHYDRVARETRISESVTLPARNHAVILVSRLHMPTLRALSYAKGTRPHRIEAVTVQVEPEDTARLREEWDAAGIDVPLVVLDSPYREVTRPVLAYIKEIHRASPRDVVTVFIPEYVVGRWWEQLLHNQSALRIKARLLFEPGVMVTSVPYQLRSSERHASRVSAARQEPLWLAAARREETASGNGERSARTGDAARIGTD